MEIYMKKYGKNSLIISILLLLLSLFLIFKPAESINFIMILIGCVIVLNGLVHTVSFFTSPNEFRAFSFELVQGIICIVLGILFIMNPTLISGFLPFIIGAWMIIESIIKFQLAFNVKEIENSHWVIMLALSIITFVLGIFIIIYSAQTAQVLTMLCGIILFVSEIMNIFESAFMMRL